MTDKDPTENDFIAFMVREAAAQIFFECGAASDMCIQVVGETRIVFGGTNRLILDDHGWSIDEPYCTPSFITAFKARER